LRTTYEKTRYAHVFPKQICRRYARSILHDDSRKSDFRIRQDKAAQIFIRNLWFVHQFLPRPRDVVRFFSTTESTDRIKMFAQRFEELKALAGTYDSWLKAASRISGKMAKFDSTKTDLLQVLQETSESTEMAESPQVPSGPAAVADLIREVERRASYQAGNPIDACEKALYFLELGRPDIAETIASEVLAENPENPVALYTNAVLLLDASGRHQKQAFVHDTMHPHELEPIEAEEFYHADHYGEESLRAWEKSSRAFLLLLKARLSWPEQFSIKCYDLSPSMWEHKANKWLFLQAAARIEHGGTLTLPAKHDKKWASKALGKIVAEIWKKGVRWMLRPAGADFLQCFIIVAAQVRTDVANDCLNKLDTAIDHYESDEAELFWRDLGAMLPIPQEPTLAETLINAATSPAFCRAVFASKSNADAAALWRRITQAGLKAEGDRRAVMQALAARATVLNIGRGEGLPEAIRLCQEMAARSDWPDTELGRKLQSCWRYSVVLLLFEQSQEVFERKDKSTASRIASAALKRALGWIESLAAEAPLLRFVESDEDNDVEIIGDFLRRQPNKFPELITYGRRLAGEEGQQFLLPLCDELELKY